MADLNAYGYSFRDKRAVDAYKKMKSDARARALERKKSMSHDEKEKESIRKHFAGEAKHFNIK